MPVDYSKWDALELSDDSDIEVHPNVDKRSFIRAKQSQIHAEREQRLHHIEALKYERTINDDLIKRISSLLGALKAHATEAETRNPGEVAFQAVMESAGSAEQDMPPPRPAGVHSDEAPLPSYTKMMAELLDQVNKALDEKKPANRYNAMVEEIQEHLAKVQDLQTQLEAKLAELEKVQKSKITSQSYSLGFDRSFVNKALTIEKKDDSRDDSKDDSEDDSKEAELLNPGYDSSGAPATPDDDDEVTASADAQEFAKIKAPEYRESHNFISAHRRILSEKDTDGILMMAFDAQLEGKDAFARQCVHQALLLQYCRALGPDGVALFFKRVTTKDHEAQRLFYKDVNDTYLRIKSRCKEINAEREKESASGAQGVEQIQLHAVEPGTVINIKIPPENSEDEAVKRGREIFESFKPEMRKALETGKLDVVNEVLGKMKIEEAEELVGHLSEAGILSVEEDIIDATTQEGQKQLKEMEERVALESPVGDPE